MNYSVIIPEVVKLIEKENPNWIKKKCQKCSYYCDFLTKFICIGGNANMIVDYIKKHPKKIKEIEKAEAEDTFAYTPLFEIDDD